VVSGCFPTGAANKYIGKIILIFFPKLSREQGAGSRERGEGSREQGEMFAQMMPD